MKKIGRALCCFAALVLGSCGGAGIHGGKFEVLVAESGPGAIAEPAIAALPDGDIIVFWVEHTDSRAHILSRLFDSEGRPAKGGDMALTNKAGESAKTWRGDPPVVRVTADGTVYVSWTAAIPNASGTTLYVSASRDGGKTFEPPVKVNDDAAPASHGMHSLAVDDNGGVYVLWLDERYLSAHREPEMHHGSTAEAAEPNAELYFASSTDGGRTFSANRRIAGDVCPCCKSSMAGPTRDGKLYIGWRQVLPGKYRHISVAASPDKGATFGPPAVVADDQWKIDACPVSGPSLAVSGDALEVAWFAGGDARPHGVYWTHTHDLGTDPFSTPLLVGEATSPGTPVLTGDTVLWSDADNLHSAQINDHAAVPERDLPDGSVPAAVKANNRTYIAAVRKDGENSAVWLILR